MASDSPGLSWSSELHGEGLPNYNREGISAEDFDIDMRDPALDAGKLLGGGFMQLGHWTLVYSSFMQFRGVIHGLELHDKALSDRDIEDVVAHLRSWMDPVIPVRPKCEPCLEGTFDRDGDSASMCEPCDIGRFSDTVGDSGACAGTCEIGSTMLATGATTARACTPCFAGRIGALSTESNGVTTMVCASCEPGRFSTTVGAESSESCAGCPVGQFSGAGWQTCERSGCMDRWAETGTETGRRAGKETGRQTETGRFSR